MAEDSADLHHIQAEIQDQVACESVAQVVVAQRRTAGVVDPGDSRGALQPPPGDVALAVGRALGGDEYPIQAGGEWRAMSMFTEQVGELRGEWDLSDRRLGLGAPAAWLCAAVGSRVLRWACE